jgi:hypothetical protein
MKLALILCVVACGNDIRSGADRAAGESSFAAVRDIFATSCGFGRCHGGETPAANLDLHDDVVCQALVAHTSCLFPDKMLVVPGRPEQSFLLTKLAGVGLEVAPASDCADSNAQMPFGAPPLAADKLALIERWIRDGAPCDRTAPADTVDAGVGLPAGIAAITTAASRIRAGDQTRITVTLSHSAPVGGQTLDVDVDDPTVLGVPSAIAVEAGLSSITFDVIGKRPAHPVAVTITAAGTAKSVSIGVTGLVLAEIEFDPASYDDGYEWIKLRNTTDVAIDLGAYSLGSGRTTYTYTMAQLAGTIPAHGCFVVGGPTSGDANAHPVYAQVFNFSPDLVNGSSSDGQAAGFALFDVPITRLGPATIPLDAVLCGANNAAGLRDAKGAIATPSCPDVAAGHSVIASSTTWVDQPTPTPNVCSPN